MYNDIEEIYKKRSPYNVIKKWTFWIYVAFILISLVLNIFNKILLMVLAFIAMPIIIKYISERVLNTKLHLSIGKKKDNEVTLQLIIKNNEKNCLKIILLKTIYIMKSHFYA